MKDIIPTYSCVVAKEIDNNFYNNKIYIMFESTYESRKKSIDEAEAIIIWPHVNEQKYITPKYIWKIKSKWTYVAKYNTEKKSFEINDLEWIVKWNRTNDTDFIKKLLKAHTVQQKFFNINLEYLDDETKLYFIEVYKINPYDYSDLYFKEKTLFYLNEYFESNWKLIEKAHDFRYFKVNTDNNLFYDIKKEIFFWEWIEEVWFSGKYKDLLNSWMRLLIKERDIYLTNSDIAKHLFPNLKESEHANQVNELKKELKRFYVIKLGIDDELFSVKILYSPSKNQYKILWNLLSNEEYLELTK